jgi:hypothetical protein
VGIESKFVLCVLASNVDHGSGDDPIGPFTDFIIIFRCSPTGPEPNWSLGRLGKNLNYIHPYEVY